MSPSLFAGPGRVSQRRDRDRKEDPSGDPPEAGVEHAAHPAKEKDRWIMCKRSDKLVDLEVTKKRLTK
jgi:hypothetical protein